jgi:SAM-dependent methyltransferase
VSGLEQAEEAEFVRYLEAKKPIDDRALNGRVWEALSEALAARSSLQPLRVLELGCGIGTMLERALERGLFGQAARVEYTGLDISPGLLAAARRRLPAWAGRWVSPAPEAVDELRRGDLLLQVQWAPRMPSTSPIRPLVLRPAAGACLPGSGGCPPRRSDLPAAAQRGWPVLL